MLSLLLACADPDDTKPPLPTAETSCLTVSPASIDFGVVARGSSTTEVLTLGNDCGDAPAADLTITDVTVGGLITMEGPASATLADGEALELTLTIDGAEVGAGTDELLVTTIEDGTSTVPISWRVTGPVLELPSTLDLGAVEVGCSRTATLRLRNAGDQPLTVEVVPDDPAVTVTSEHPWPITLEPAWVLDVALTWAPTTSDPPGAVRVVTNDAFAPETEVGLTGTTTLDRWRTETFLVDGVAPTDILITADSSMTGGARGALGDEAIAAFPSLLAALAETDVRVAAVARDSGCVAEVGGALYADGDDAVEDAADLLTTQSNLLFELGYMHNVERSFSLLAAALQETGEGGCNEGLLREEAMLVTISISDEDEQSLVDDEEAVELVTSQREDGTLRMHALAGPYPDGCDDKGPGTRYQMAAEATGGTLLSICEPMVDTLVALAGESFWFDPRLPLADVAVAGTVSVTVDGAPTDAWTLDGATVLLREEPAQGSTVEVRYQADVPCGE